MLLIILRSLRAGQPAGQNPWGAPTLEWSIPSPPPHYNFAVVPTVRSLYPLWNEDGETVNPPDLPYVDESSIHMPSPSYWPLVVAAAITIAAGALLIWQWHSWTGYLVISLSGFLGIYSIYRWVFEPITATESIEAGVHH